MSIPRQQKLPAFSQASLIAAALLLSACAASAPSKGAPFKIAELSQIELDDETVDLLSESAPVNPRDGAPYRTFAIDLHQKQTLHLNVRADFSPSIAIFAPGGTLVGLANDTTSTGQNEIDLISHIPRDGRYIVVVSSSSRGEFGSFQLNATLFDGQNELAIPDSIRTNLLNTGRTHPTTGAAMNSFFFDVPDHMIVDIRLASHQFDTFLSLVDAANGQILAENDDADDTLDSRIITSLEPGSYEIWASAWSSDSRGQFSLSIQEADLKLSDSFVLGAPYLGLLGADLQPIPSTGRRGIPLPFELNGPAALIASMDSEALDSYLYLTDSQGRVRIENDDATGLFTMNSRFAINLEPGQYTLWASSYSPSAGLFEIETSLGPYSQGGTIELDSTIEGVLTDDAELSNYRDTKTLYYTFDVKEMTGVVIDLRSSDFDSFLILENSDGGFLEEDDDHGAGLDAQISRVLQPGTYRIGVTCYSGECFGRFSLQLRQAINVLGTNAQR